MTPTEQKSVAHRIAAALNGLGFECNAYYEGGSYWSISGDGLLISSIADKIEHSETHALLIALSKHVGFSIEYSRQWIWSTDTKHSTEAKSVIVTGIADTLDQAVIDMILAWWEGPKSG
jgi:hypothetical protein